MGLPTYMNTIRKLQAKCVMLFVAGIPLAGEVRGGGGGGGRRGRHGGGARVPARRDHARGRRAAHVRAARAGGDRTASVSAILTSPIHNLYYKCESDSVTLVCR